MKLTMKNFIIVIGLIFFIPALFFIMGILIGLFWPNVPRSNFYEYYWFMFPSLFPGGIFISICYLICVIKRRDGK